MSSTLLYLLTLVLSFCSILYELVLAQSMAATLGNTFLRYNITIGLYLASLGLGAMLCREAPRRELVRRLVDVELFLAWFGALAPLLVLSWDAIVFRAGRLAGIEFRGWICQALVYAFDHGLIVLIGGLSGFELPLLMRLGSDGPGGGRGGDRSRQVLALDYVGTLLGAVSFPLLILPGAGLLTAAAAAGLLSAAAGFALILSDRDAPRSRLAPYAAALALSLILIGSRDFVQREVAERIYAGASRTRGTAEAMP